MQSFFVGPHQLQLVSQLGSGIRGQVTKVPRPSGLTLVVAMRQPTPARLFEADLKEEQSLSTHMHPVQRGQLHHGYDGLRVLWHLHPDHQM